MSDGALKARLQVLSERTEKALEDAHDNDAPREIVIRLAEANAFARAVLESDELDERRLAVAIRLAEDALALVES
jgi:hypothetical protein